jgi:hypothetical protein
VLCVDDIKIPNLCMDDREQGKDMTTVDPRSSFLDSVSIVTA